MRWTLSAVPELFGWCVVEPRQLNQRSNIDTSLPRSACGSRIRQSFGRFASSILCWAAAFVRKGVFTGWEEAFTHSVKNSPAGGIFFLCTPRSADIRSIVTEPVAKDSDNVARR